MIKVKLEIFDMDEGKMYDINLPLDSRNIIPRDHEYYIISSSPCIDDWNLDDIWKLNEFVEEVNSENAEMTAEFVSVLMEASSALDVSDVDFIEKLKNNDFMFESITDYDLGLFGNAAKHLAKDAGVPFDEEIPKYVVNAMMNETVENYIDWSSIWSKYSDMGFQIIEVEEGAAEGEYVVLWRK